MKTTLRFSTQFVRDMEKVLAHTLNRFGQQKFDEYRTGLREALTALANNANPMGSRERPDIGASVRTYHLSTRRRKARHLILYQVDPTGIIRLGRLLHDSMDIARHLPSDFEE